MIIPLVYDCLLLFIDLLFVQLAFLLFLEVFLALVLEVQIPRDKYILFGEFLLFLLHCPHINESSTIDTENSHKL